MIKEERKTNRIGGTVVTSVSVTKEFDDLIKEYKLSPSDVFRKGVAVCLFDLEVFKYQTDLNKKRSVYVKRFMQNIKNDEKRMEVVDNLIEFSKEVLMLKEELNYLDKEEEE